MSRKAYFLFIIVILAVIGTNSEATSQDVFQLLMNTSSFECKFSAGKTAEITEIGKPLKFNQDGTTIDSKGDWIFHETIDKEFPSISFRQIRRGEGLSLTALMSGNTGNAYRVLGYLGAGYMTFVEPKEMGGITATTIFAELDRNKELIAVHSRHSKIYSKVIASQYYGSCRPINP